MYEYDYDERTNFEKELDAAYAAEHMFDARPWLIDCTKCDGSGDGGGVWDDELMVFHAWVCGACNGTGSTTDPEFDWEAYDQARLDAGLYI